VTLPGRISAERCTTPRSWALEQWIQEVGSMSEMSCTGSFQTCVP
jgi:hypothetical protein